ncbi:hypothetical protein SS05631_c29840 [Sinorhizobium sp. CCBAU 05631]|nr:hypothetical protein SS05631_c29840 [Sinorhizobium sp. CCBAU 05631]
MIAERPQHVPVADHAKLEVPDCSCRILNVDTLRERCACSAHRSQIAGRRPRVACLNADDA